jgi:hypothetical protein
VINNNIGVGLSIYHYGSEYPWKQNSIPSEKKFEGILRGNSNNPHLLGYYDFYGIFSSGGTENLGHRKPLQNVTKGDKPFILAETGATYHYGKAI